MTWSTLLDIYIHWKEVASGSRDINPKLQKYSRSLKQLIKDEIHSAEDVSTKMSFQMLMNILSNIVDDEEHFPTKDFIFTINPEKFMTKTVIYGIISADNNADILKPQNKNRFNNALKPITAQEW